MRSPLLASAAALSTLAPGASISAAPARPAQAYPADR